MQSERVVPRQDSSRSTGKGKTGVPDSRAQPVGTLRRRTPLSKPVDVAELREIDHLRATVATMREEMQEVEDERDALQAKLDAVEAEVGRWRTRFPRSTV